MMASPLEALLYSSSLGVLWTLPHPEDLQEVQRSQGPEMEGKEIGFMAPSSSPPYPQRVIQAFAGYTHRQARGTWEPGLALQEQWERLRGCGLLGPCSSLLQPFPNSGSRLPMLSLPQATYLDSSGPNRARLPLGSSYTLGKKEGRSVRGKPAP